MTTQTWILQALTPLHVGEGAAVGSVHLPVARERHTRWPWIPGAGIKGALRARATSADCPPDLVERAFGPPQDRASTEARPGSLRFGPGVLLALSVRSLFGGAALLTCPAALARLARALRDAPPIPDAPSLEGVLVTSKTPLVEDGAVILEDIELTGRRDETVGAWADQLDATWGLGRQRSQGLAVVHDDLFTHACLAWVPTRTRAAIDDEKGVVEEGKLFTEEALAPDTLFWTTVGGLDHEVAELLPGPGEAWRLGGHATVGAGRLVHHVPRSQQAAEAGR